MPKRGGDGGSGARPKPLKSLPPLRVQVQRPNCEPKLRGDIANLKSFSQKLASQLPVSSEWQIVSGK